ncbi:hypothetical protein D922_00162 [Enterococcus faecalis 06-MB-DW-09]|jgi:hypothetical protein|nr:hypothetical protein D922_00162 [Enterococcus faecalis 06-MB-DW-09]
MNAEESESLSENSIEGFAAKRRQKIADFIYKKITFFVLS